MQTEVYIIRHGSTPANTGGKYHGITDTPLLPLGEAQAERLKERFHEISLAGVYTSPLQRARRTATPLAEDHGLTPVVLPELLEMDGGLFEDVAMIENQKTHPEEVYNLMYNPPAACCPGGESMRQVFDRMTSTLDRLVRENQGKAIAIISHGCALQNLWCYVQNIPYHEMKPYMVRNSSVRKILWDEDKGYHAEYIGDFSHLPAHLTFEPSPLDPIED